MAPRKPNYRFERQERERLKAAKKAEKAARRAAEATDDPAGETADGTPSEPRPDAEAEG